MLAGIVTSHSTCARHHDDVLRIGWVDAMANTPLLIAEKKGLFSKHGVNVDIQRFSSGPLLRRALEAEDMDMAYIGMPPIYHAYENGLKIKIVAKVNYGQAAIIVRNDSAIMQLSNLKGKRIAGVRKGSGMDVLLRGFILKERAGLVPGKDLTIVHMPAKVMQASVNRGIVDAAFTWEPFVSHAELSGEMRVLFDMNKAVKKYPWYVVAATEDTIHLKHEQMTKLLMAHQEAIRFMNDSPDEANEIIADAYNLFTINAKTGKKVDQTEIIQQARSRLGWVCQFNKEDKHFLQKLIDYSRELGFIHKKIDADEIIYRDVIGNVYQ